MMYRNGFAALVFFCWTVADAFDYSLVLKHRKLVGDSSIPKEMSNVTQGSSVHPAGFNNSDPKPVDANNFNKGKAKDNQVSNNLMKVDPKGLNNTNIVNSHPQNQTNNGNSSEISKGGDSVSPPPQDEIDKEENHKKKEKKKKKDNKSSLRMESSESCKGIPNRCRDQNALIGCIKSFDGGVNELVVLVQNEGDDILKVNLNVSTSLGSPLKDLELPSKQTRRVNISLDTAQSSVVILNGGHGECVLHIGPAVSEENFFLNLPSYDELVTPINGAYFLILTVLIFGGSWACCKFRKSRRQGSVPYQELEMALPESDSARNTETADGWDAGWDDDWNEDDAVKLPGGHRVGNVSGNGLMSRSLNRGDWEHDWDD